MFSIGTRVVLHRSLTSDNAQERQEAQNKLHVVALCESIAYLVVATLVLVHIGTGKNIGVFKDKGISYKVLTGSIALLLMHPTIEGGIALYRYGHRRKAVLPGSPGSVPHEPLRAEEVSQFKQIDSLLQTLASPTLPLDTHPPLSLENSSSPPFIPSASSAPTPSVTSVPVAGAVNFPSPSASPPINEPLLKTELRPQKKQEEKKIGLPLLKGRDYLEANGNTGLAILLFEQYLAAEEDQLHYVIENFRALIVELSLTPDDLIAVLEVSKFSLPPDIKSPLAPGFIKNEIKLIFKMAFKT